MSAITSLYYFPNDLFRQRGIRISSLEMDQLGEKLGTKITLRADKAGGLGFFSKFVMRNMGIDILIITIEGEEPAVRETIRAIHGRFGSYETQRSSEGGIAREMKKELEGKPTAA